MPDAEMMFTAKGNQVVLIKFQFRIDMKRLDMVDIEVVRSTARFATRMPSDELIADIDPFAGPWPLERDAIDGLKLLVDWFEGDLVLPTIKSV